MDIRDAVCGWILSSDQSRVLIVQNDDGLFSVPGGGVEPGESVNHAIVREVFEETNLETRIVHLIAVAEGFKTSAPGKRFYFHFLMEQIDPTAQPCITRPQEILKIEWMDWGQAVQMLDYLPLPANEMAHLPKALVLPTTPRYP